MSRRVELPSIEKVHEAVDVLTKSADGKPPTVTALADYLGLSNSTFWRYFSDLAQAVADNRRVAVRANLKPLPTAASQGRAVEARLRAQVANLSAQVETAAARVRQLTLENHALRENLAVHEAIPRIPRQP